MAYIIPSKRPPRQEYWRRKEKRGTDPVVFVWILLAFVTVFYVVDFITSNKGTVAPTAAQGFSICGWGSQRNCVIDGDTIKIAGSKIRLEDIDTPEIHDYKCSHELEKGQRAKARLLELVNSGPFEVVSNGGDDLDRYGRKLRYLKRNGQSLGSVLVNEGLARPYAGGRRSWCS